MPNMPATTLTIITVVFNGEKTLENAIDSLRNIKTQNIEYIIIDGKSTDKTCNIINKNSDVVDVYISESDNGIFDAMNKGICLANGKYTLFLNADDQLYMPGFNNAVRELISSNHSILSCITMVNSDTDGSIYFPYPKSLPYGPSVPHPSTFVKTEILKNNLFDLKYKISADYDLFLRLYLKGYEFKILHEIVSLFAPGGASSNLEKGLIEIKEIRKTRLGIKYFIYITTEKIKKLVKNFR